MTLWLSMYVGFFLAAVVLCRWVVLLVPVVLIPLGYYGLHVGWWGCCGVGDAAWWEYAAIFTAIVVAVTAVLVLVAKLAARTPLGTRVVNLAASITAAGAIAIIVLVDKLG